MSKAELEIDLKDIDQEAIVRMVGAGPGNADFWKIKILGKLQDLSGNLGIPPDYEEINSYLKAADLSGVTITDADLGSFDFEKTRFNEAKLREIYWTEGKLSDVDFSDADLDSIQFGNSSMKGATFE